MNFSIVSDKRKSDLSELRQIVHEIYPDVTERILKNMMYFKIDGINMFIFGSQKQNMCFYFSKALMILHKEGLKGLNLGKGTIRFTDIHKIDRDTLKSIIKGAKEFPFEFSKRGDSTR